MREKNKTKCQSSSEGDFLFLAKNRRKGAINVKNNFSAQGVECYSCVAAEMRGRVRRRSEWNACVFFQKWADFFLGIWALPLFNLSWFFFSPSCCQGNYQLTWPWSLCHFASRWNYKLDCLAAVIFFNLPSLGQPIRKGASGLHAACPQRETQLGWGKTQLDLLGMYSSSTLGKGACPVPSNSETFLFIFLEQGTYASPRTIFRSWFSASTM